MIAYSGHTIAFTTFRSDTSAHMRSDLDTILLGVGWTLSSSISNGKIYSLTSPDGFSAHCLIQDDGSYSNPGVLAPGPSVVVQMLNVAETVSGFPHQLAVGGGLLQIVAGKCQAFISTPGGAPRQGSVAMGVPAQPTLAGACTAGVGSSTLTDIWWSCGGSPFIFQGVNDFRVQSLCYAGSSVYLNGAVQIPPTNNAISPFSGYLQYYVLTPADVYRIQAAHPIVTYQSHLPLQIDALVGWQFTIQGQLWDAFLLTAPGTLDQVRTFQDTDQTGKPITLQAITWNASDYYSSLMLITSIGGAGIGNYAY